MNGNLVDIQTNNNPTDRKPIVYIDMDNVLCDYTCAYNKYMEEYPDVKYPQSQYGFFASLNPIEGAIDAIKELDSIGYDVYFASAPSYMNPMSLAEKNIWIRNNFGIDWCKKLILIYDKSLLVGEYLIDDNDTSNNQHKFKGEFIHFGKISPFYGDMRSWEKVLRMLKNRKKS